MDNKKLFEKSLMVLLLKKYMLKLLAFARVRINFVPFGNR